MPSVVEMVAELHGDIESFRRSMGDAVSVARQTGESIGGAMRRIEEGLLSISKAGERITGVIRLMSRLALVGGTVYSAFRATSSVLDSLTAIRDGADAAGVTTDEYQQLAFAANQAGVSQADFSKQLLAFAEQAHEASQGSGKLFDALTKYNPAALEALRHSGSVTAQMQVMAEAVRTAAGEQERAALVTAGFGESNAELQRMLLGGSQGIDQAAQKARELGVVFDEELIRKAPEVSEKFEALINQVGAEFQAAIVQSAPSIVALAENLANLLQIVTPLASGIADMVGALVNAGDAGLPLAERSTAALNRELATASKELAEIQQRLADGNFSWVDSFFGNEERMRSELEGRMQYIRGIQQELTARGWKAGFEAMPSFRIPAAAAAEEPAATSGPAPGTARALAELQRIEEEFLKSTRQTAELIQVEHERQLASLQKSLDEGLIAADDYTKARAELEATLTAKLATEAQKQLEPISKAISGTLTRAFDDFVERGELNFEQLTRSMIANLAKVAFQMAVIQPLFGGGPGGAGGGGIFGQVLGSVMHDGGTVGSGGRSRSVPGLAFAMAPRFHNGGMPGLRSGEVPAILERGETVLPKGMGGAGGRSIVVNIQTPDVESFRRSEGQVAAMLSRAVSAGRRNM